MSLASSVYHGYEDPHLKEKENYLDAQLNLSEFLQEVQYHEEAKSLLKQPPSSSENNEYTNNPKFGTKKKSWKKYYSLLLKFQSKFTKQSKTSSQKKEVSMEESSFNAWKSKHGSILGAATGVASKLASIHGAIRKKASGPLVRCFPPAKEEEMKVPYMQLEKLGYLRREAFGPVYLGYLK